MLEMQYRIGLAVIGKRGGLRSAIELATVELERQLRLHFDLAFRLQIADEGHTQRQPADLVRFVNSGIVELHHPVAQRNVVEREMRGLVLFGRLRIFQMRDHVVEVKVARRSLRKTHDGLIHLQRIKHRRQAPQRLNVSICVDTCNGKLRLVALRCGNAQVAQRQL